MQDQISTRIMEQVPAQPTGEIVHYIPHQAVVREQAETTIMRIIYDCSLRANSQSPSLNNYLETGPPLQALLMKQYSLTFLSFKFKGVKCGSIVLPEIFRRPSFKSECRSKTKTLSGSSGLITWVRETSKSTVSRGSYSEQPQVHTSLERHCRWGEELQRKTL